MSRNRDVNKHTIETINNSLINKELNSFITAIKIEKNNIILLDKDFGEYSVDIKSSCAKTSVPFHKERTFQNKLEIMKTRFIGKNISGVEIKDVIYGPDHGYKNRSFYLIYINKCGHDGIASHASLTKHKENFICQSCSMTKHGERKKKDGKLLKRSNTYIHWQRIKKNLPVELQDYKEFRRILGEKPAKKADVIFIDGKPQWKTSILTDNYEINLISSAIRQAFRYSSIYKNIVQNSKVETEDGTRYRCAHCNNLFKRSEIEVDHIDPIAPLSGESLKREDLISRIWTENVQILDYRCHAIKTKEQTAIRKINKERLKIMQEWGQETLDKD